MTAEAKKNKKMVWNAWCKALGLDYHVFNGGMTKACRFFYRDGMELKRALGFAISSTIRHGFTNYDTLIKSGIGKPAAREQMRLCYPVPREWGLIAPLAIANIK
jgi:hypothetical protein